VKALVISNNNRDEGDKEDTMIMNMVEVQEVVTTECRRRRHLRSAMFEHNMVGEGYGTIAYVSAIVVVLKLRGEADTPILVYDDATDK
jgi:hypothetical protein